jgi:hypothetical protein
VFPSFKTTNIEFEISSCTGILVGRLVSETSPLNQVIFLSLMVTFSLRPYVSPNLDRCQVLTPPREKKQIKPKKRRPNVLSDDY